MRTGRGVFRVLFVVAFLMICGEAGAPSPASSMGLTPQASTPGARRKEQEQWLRRGRTIPGDSTAALRYLAYQQIQQASVTKPPKQVAKAVPHATAVVGWTPLGPGPLASDASGTGAQDYSWVSGRATAVAVDPNDTSGNTIYVGGAFGGLWRSSNAGPLCADPSTVTWNVPAAQNPEACLGSANSSPASLLDDQPTLSVGAIAIQPQLSNQNPAASLPLVGTGETNSSSDSYYGLGILRSPDAGNTWTLIRQDASGVHKFAGIGFSQIAFDTATPSLVVAAAEGTSQGELDGLQNPLTANLGLYYSTNSGQAWKLRRSDGRTYRGSQFDHRSSLRRSRDRIFRGNSLSRLLQIGRWNSLDPPYSAARERFA